MKDKTSTTGSPCPPRIPERIFQFFFPDSEIYTTLGDLEEIFKHTAAQKGIQKARFWYWGQLLKAIPHRIIGFIFLDIPMLLLSLKILVRNLRKNKVFSFLNLFALTFGLTCFFLIYFYTRYEFTYDSFHRDFQRIYRVRARNISNAGFSSTAAFFASAMENQIPEIEATAQYGHAFEPVVKMGQEKFQTRAKFADENFLKLFHFPSSKKSKMADRPFSEPYTAVLTETCAQRFFGSEDPLGKSFLSIIRGEQAELTVTGILSDPPQNTHFDFDFLISFSTSQALPRFKALQEAVSYRLTTTYVKLRKNASVKNCLEKICGIVDRIYPEARSAGVTRDLQPVTEIHLRPDNFDNAYTRSLYFYLALGTLILLIACINYVNLSTARSTLRMRIFFGMTRCVPSLRSSRPCRMSLPTSGTAAPTSSLLCRV